MAEIRQQIRALVARHQLDFRLRGRPDIVQLAAPLIAWQDDPSLSPPSMPTALPDATTLAARLVAHDEFWPKTDQTGIAMPGGVRHSLLQWSPILQIARASSENSCIDGMLIDKLPSNPGELNIWLETSLGMRRSGWVEPSKLGKVGYDPDTVDEADEAEALALEQARLAFAKRFGFSIADFADWLLGIRSSDPVLYILLLSR